jgi:hypothetical protein
MTTRVRRVLPALGALLLALGAAALAVRSLPVRGPETQEPVARVLPDDGGAILQVACIASSARRSSLRNAPLVAGIVNALPASAHIAVLTNDRDAFVVASDPTPGRVDFIDLPANLNFTIWPQDPFVVVVGSDGPALLASADFPRLDDRVLGEQLAKRLGWPCRVSELLFEGGNIVAGRRHVFIGANTIAQNALRLDIDQTEVARRFQRELGRPVVVVGPLPQPVGHIDMMLTPLDDHRLALADTQWGARLAREHLRRNPRNVTDFENSCERMCFGDPAIRELRGPGGETMRPPKIVGQTAAAIDGSEAIAAKLDRLAEELAKFDYQVERVPMLYGIEMAIDRPAANHPSQSNRQSAASDGHRQGRYPTLTYNNVLMETRPEGRVVYLPQYGFDPLDQAGREAWKRLSFRVVPVGGFAVSALHGGSLRCCAKVLRREIWAAGEASGRKE